jgi:hypothetical protein
LYFCIVAGEQKPAGSNSLVKERSLTSPGGPEGGEKKPAVADSLGVERSLTSPKGPEGGAKKPITEGENAMRRKGMGLIEYQALPSLHDIVH